MALTRSAIAAEVLALTLTLVWSLEAIAEPIPRDLQGQWCAIRAIHLTLTATAATFGNNKPAEAVWVRKDGSHGRIALHWTGEGIVSGLEYNEAAESLRLDDLGWNMGEPRVIYRRCEHPRIE